MDEVRQDPRPIGGVPGVLAAFDKAPVVALGETHRVQELADFILALLHHPQFPAAAQAIVVEFGNARHQPLIDRFVDGEPIAGADLRRVWRDLLSAPTADAPIYENFFRTVRAINRMLPAERRIRVVLGDPPIDWQSVASMEDVRPFLERELHLAGAVEQAIARYGRVLLIAGIGHVVRAALSRWTPHGPDDRTAVRIVEAKHPGSVYVVVPHVGFGSRNAELEPQLAQWPNPALLPTRESWIGALSPNLLFAAGMDWDGEDPYAHVTLADVADAYLYLGPRASLTVSHPDPAIYRGDPEYVAELQRRHSILFGRPLDLDALYTDKSVQYQRLGQ